jgi:hypothetical protein
MFIHFSSTNPGTYRKYDDNDSNSDQTAQYRIPRILQLFRPNENELVKTSFDRSDFEFDKSASIYDNDLIDFENDQMSETINKYRTAYPLEQSSVKLGNDYFKSLESMNNFCPIFVHFI